MKVARVFGALAGMHENFERRFAQKKGGRSRPKAHLRPDY
jgi:hypothetical protein